MFLLLPFQTSSAPALCATGPSFCLSPLFFPSFSVFSCTHCLTVDALLLSSLLVLFMSQNVQDRHNRRGYNVEKLEISIMVFFPPELAAQTVSTGTVDLHRRVWETVGMWQVLWEKGPCNARWMMPTIHFNRAAGIQTLPMNIHKKLKAV